MHLCIVVALKACMTHPGEQFYPQGVHWDDPIARGTLPDLLSNAAAEFGARPAIEFRDRPISYAELETMVETAASAFLRAGYGKDNSVALFLGNTPDHPVNFFGALKAGARIVHLSPLDGEIALSHKLSDSGARDTRHQQSLGAVADRAEIPRQGPARPPDRLRGRSTGARPARRKRRCPNNPAIVTYRQFIDGATKPAQWPAIDVDDVALLQYTGGTTGLPKGAMLSHGNLTAAVSIYDVWGKPARAERNAIERVICVLPLFHIYALTVVLLSSLAPRQSDLAAPALRRRGRDARHRGQARHLFPRRADDVDRDRRTSRSRQARSFLAGELRLRRRAAAGRGREDLRAPGRHEAEERLGHDRNLLARHRSSQGRPGQAGLDRTGAARHRDGRGVAGRPEAR